MQPLPVTINIVKTTKTYGSYNAIAARVLGALQIALGVPSIVFNALAMAFSDASLAVVGYGIWLPAFWFIAGAFGIVSSFRKTKCMIITTMVMSILSASFMTAYFVLASLQMTLISDSCYCDYGYDDCVCSEGVQYAMGALMLVTAIAETKVAIVAAVLCCRAICCCRQQPYTTLQENGAQNHIVVNTPSGTQNVSIPAGFQVVNQATKTYDSYSTLAARVLGALQIALGVASIVFNALAIVFAPYESSAVIGYGFWSPVFWFIAGAFGIVSSFRKTKCMIVTTMVMSILSASFMTAYFVLTSLQMAVISDSCYCAYGYDDCVCPEGSEGVQYAMGALMLVTAVAETIVAIVAAVLCCRAICCCRQQQPYTTLQENGAQNQIVVNTPSGTQNVSIPAGFQVVNQGATGQQVPPSYTISTGN